MLLFLFSIWGITCNYFAVFHYIGLGQPLLRKSINDLDDEYRKPPERNQEQQNSRGCLSSGNETGELPHACMHFHPNTNLYRHNSHACAYTPIHIHTHTQFMFTKTFT